MTIRKTPGNTGGNKTTADVIIIGSGFAGAVAADRLVGAGLKVCVLERGPWRSTAPVLAKRQRDSVPLPVQNRPSLIMRNIRRSGGSREVRLNKRGLLELHVGKGVKTLASSSVGGGSHVWSALAARPDDFAYWDNCAEGFSEALMAPHYERVGKELGVVRPCNIETIPNHTCHAWQGGGWFDGVSEAEQYPFAFLFPAKNGGGAHGNRLSSELNGEDGLFGSARAAKANVEAIYLLPHLDAGLTVRDMHEVLRVARTDAGGYEVIAKDHHSAESKSFFAPRVVMAAGTMNSIKILFASQESGGLAPIAHLGEGFGTNGDCMGLWMPKDAHRNSRLGSPIHGRLKTRDHPVGVNLIIGGMDAVPVPAWAPGFIEGWMAGMAKRRFQLIAMGVDRANGSISFSQNRFDLDYDLRGSPVYQAIFEMFDRLSTLTGAPVKFDRKTAVTAHPMGGCRIASSASEGVVDGKGEVFGHSGLYVTDASVLPAPTGGPPSLSIAAWSSHVASSLVRQH